MPGDVQYAHSRYSGDDAMLTSLLSVLVSKRVNCSVTEVAVCS